MPFIPGQMSQILACLFFILYLISILYFNMKIDPLPITARLEDYRQMAERLYRDYKAGDRETIQFVRENHREISRLPGSEFPGIAITLDDIHLSLTCWYHFENWQKLEEWVKIIDNEGSRVFQFELAIEAIIDGDLATLRSLLQQDPGLVRMRSMRVHHSMLLHYVGANGVENYRQRSPANAVNILNCLLEAGAEVDAEADMYGGGSTTLGLVATSIWPAKAKVLVPLMETLLKAGADIGPSGTAGNGHSIVIGCLHNGRPEAADFLARHGAMLNLEGAAGVGRLDVVESFFNGDGSLTNHATWRQAELGFGWACEYGHKAIVEFLMDKGIDPDEPVDGMPGLHWAVMGGHIDIVRFLIQRGASLEIKNIYDGNPLGAALWAVCNSDEVYRWPETDTDFALIIQILLDAGTEIEPGTIGWLSRQDKIPSLLKERIIEIFRTHGAES